MNLSRRKLLSMLAASGSQLLLPTTRIKATTGKNAKFVLYIHFGSADGLTTGMLQPREVVLDGSNKLARVGNWQQKLFWNDDQIFRASSHYRQGDDGNLCFNSNVNVHYQDQGNRLIFNEYSKVLQPIQDHICMAVGNSRSLAHHDAASFQITGNRFGSPVGSWVANFAQATHGSSPFANVVASPSASTAREQTYVKIFSAKGQENNNVAIINSANLDQMRDMLSDPTTIPDAEGSAQKFWQTMQQMNRGGSDKYLTIKESVSFYIDNLLAGVPEFASNSPLRTSIEKAINSKAVQDAINDSSLPGGAVCDRGPSNRNTELNDRTIANLQLAAGLIASGRAQGMLFSVGDHDHHAGGSAVHAPRSASALFAAVQVFWQWVMAENKSDDVMVIISHDFTRTPANGKEMPNKIKITTRTAGGTNNVNLAPHGNDHHSIMAMTFINGKVPAGGRLGGIHDNYTAFGSNDQNGVPNPMIPPYTSDSLVGTMLMRCFDDLFPDVETIKETFKNFDEPINWLLD